MTAKFRHHPWYMLLVDNSPIIRPIDLWEFIPVIDHASKIRMFCTSVHRRVIVGIQLPQTELDQLAMFNIANDGFANIIRVKENLLSDARSLSKQTNLDVSVVSTEIRTHMIDEARAFYHEICLLPAGGSQ